MKTSEPIPTLQNIRRQYAPYLRRGDAIRLCATLGAGSAAFKRWCLRSPVKDRDFRVILAGYKEFHYLRETILAALHPEAGK